MSVWLVLRVAGSLLGCLLGADALARFGTLHLTFFDVAEFVAAIVLVVALVPIPYRLTAIGATLAVAAIMGVARTVNALAHALLAGEALPARPADYVVQVIVYGIYVVGFLWIRLAHTRGEKTIDAARS